MSSTTARDPRDDRKRTNEALSENDQQFIQGLKVFSGDSESVSGVAGGNAQNSPKSPAGNYLAREGDSMVGPIALGPPVNFRVQIGTEENINISQLGDNPQYSSNIELDSIQPNGFVLDRIDGANFDGQILVIRTFGPDSFTISQATLANGGNIQTPNDEDFTLPPLSMIQLVFDEALVVFANTGGTWRVMSGGDVGGADTGTYTATRMDQDQSVNLAVNDHIQFNEVIEDGGIVLQGQTPTFDQTSGIYELKEGKTYYLSAYLAMSFANGADVATLAWWDITNGVQISQRMTPKPNNAANTQTMNLTVETIFTPATDVTVELRIISLSGAINTVFFTASQANIFEFSGTQGPAGPQGPAGSGGNWKIPARALKDSNVANLASFDVNVDGITLVQGDRVLLVGQDTLSENGLWEVGVVGGGLAPLTRPSDFDQDSEVVAETMVPIEEGDTYEYQLWQLISINPLTIDVSDQVWQQFGDTSFGIPGTGEDGKDATGTFVLDGRIFTGIDELRKIQQDFKNVGPTYAMADLLYVDPVEAVFNSEAVPPRLIVCGRMDQTPLGANGASSDDYGRTWQVNQIGPGGNSYGTFAYDPVQNVIVCIGNAAIDSSRIRRSTNRGNSWSGTAYNLGINLIDVIWSKRLGLFVGVLQNTITNAIVTSPDGNTWTQRVTPAGNPIPPSISVFWRVIADGDGGFDKLVVLGQNSQDILTSVDGITWVLENPMDVDGSGTGFTFQQQPTQLVWSEGQQLFLCRPPTGNTDTEGIFLSEDGLIWERVLVPGFGVGVLEGFYDIIWDAYHSLWIGIGSSSVFVNGTIPMFWASYDGQTWERLPKKLRRTDVELNNISTFGNTIPRVLTYSPDYGYIWGLGNGQETTGAADYDRNRIWRTQIYFNDAFDNTSSM